MQAVESSPKRQRTPSHSAAQTRAALTVIRPVLADLSGWQKQTATLIGIAERARARGESDAAHAEEARMLDEAIAQERRQLSTMLAGSPQTLSQHSRVVDALRALDSLAIGVSRARFLLSTQ
jgi:hypothetical protein